MASIMGAAEDQKSFASFLQKRRVFPADFGLKTKAKTSDMWHMPCPRPSMALQHGSTA
jgi:hypothetical protein